MLKAGVTCTYGRASNPGSQLLIKPEPHEQHKLEGKEGFPSQEVGRTAKTSITCRWVGGKPERALRTRLTPSLSSQRPAPSHRLRFKGTRRTILNPQ